jgi:hypothetical protein
VRIKPFVFSAALWPVRGEFIKIALQSVSGIAHGSASASDSSQNSLASRADTIWQAAKEHAEDNHLNTMCQQR